MKKAFIMVLLLTAAHTAEAAVSAKLQLERKGELLYARVLVEQEEDKSGTLTLRWTAPPNGYCLSSVQTLKYRYKTYHTSAYRTLYRTLKNTPEVGNTHMCVGTWKAAVLNEKGKVLAKGQYDFYDQ